MEAGLRSYAKSGLGRGEALRMMEPLVRETVDNVFRLGTVDALTGPIARGDGAVVARQVDALTAWDQAMRRSKELGAIAIELARAAKADPRSARRIARTLGTTTEWGELRRPADRRSSENARS